MQARREVRARLEGLVAGERSGNAWLYDTFAGRLLRWAQLRYGHLDGLDVEDLLHDAYVFFLQHDARVLRRFLERVPEAEQTPARLERYLWDLLCGLASNRRRSRAARKVVAITEGDRQIDGSPGAERATIDRDLLKKMADCLERQGARIYLYYKMRFRDGMTSREIAQATGWSLKATYKLRQALRGASESCAQELGISSR